MVTPQGLLRQSTKALLGRMHSHPHPWWLIRSRGLGWQRVERGKGCPGGKPEGPWRLEQVGAARGCLLPLVWRSG